MKETISFKDMVNIIAKRWKLIMIMVILSVIIGITFTNYFIKPIYQSSTLLLVNRATDESQVPYTRDLYSNSELINTYNVIITTPVILKAVIDELNLEGTESLKSMKERITVKSEGESQVLSISVRHEDSLLAMIIANKIGEVFQREIGQIMNVNNVTILSTAEVENTPISPNKTFNMVISFMVGLMLSLCISFLLEYFDGTIKDEDELERLLGLPVIGSVNEIDVRRLKLRKRNTEKERSITIHTSGGESIGS